MACTLYSIYRFEQVAGRRPEPGRATLRTLLWSLLITFQPHLTVQDVGGLDPSEYAIATRAGMELIRPPGGVAAEAQEPPDKPMDWLGTWAIGRFDLGLPEAEFWQLSPGMFDALWKRLEEAGERTYYGHAMTCAAVTNVHIDPEKGTPVTPDFFMPGKRGEAEHKRIAGEQRAAMKSKLGDALALLGGRRKK